ncbi:DUF2846 domain-containing protein [Flavobacteriales bacterium]|nr:DUF2846 domain-containing protein [Flavobacteriales bacterium]
MNKTILTVALLAGLSIPTFATVETEPETTVSSEKATIHLYRTKSLYWSGYQLKVFADGNKVKLKNKGYHQIEVEPGTTEIYIKDIGRATIPLEVEAGNDYYVQAYLKRSFFWSIPKLAEVTPRFGKQQINNLKKKKSNN